MQRPDLERGLGELVREEPEAGDERAPAPVCGVDGEDVDAEGVAGARAGDVDGAVDLVELGEGEGGEGGGGGGGGDLAVGGVEAVEGDDFAGLDAKDGRDAGG